MSVTSLFIAIPAYDGRMTMQTALSLAQLVGELHERKVNYGVSVVCGDAIVQHARNELVGQFMESPATHMLMVDADMEFRAADVFAMLDADRGVVANCAKRGLDWNRVRAAAMKGEADLVSSGTTGTARLDFSKAEVVENENVSVSIAWPDFVEAFGAGTGFMLVRRDVIKRLYARVPVYFAKEGGPRREVFAAGARGCSFEGEDYCFTRRVREMGESIWLYTKAVVGHVSGRDVLRLPVDYCATFPSREEYRKAKTLFDAESAEPIPLE